MVKWLLLSCLASSSFAQTSFGIYDTNCAASGALTVSASISSGSQTVTPSSMTPASNQVLEPGQMLGVNIGQADAEYVTIATTTSSTFTATFGQSHAGGANINTYCFYLYFQSATNLPTDKVYVYVQGGGFTNWNVGCYNTGGPRLLALNICSEIFAMTQKGYQVYLPMYSVNRDGPFPLAMQDIQAFLSYAVNANLPGNWQNITTNGDSAGTLYVLMNAIRAKSAWNTDGHGTTPRTGSNNTNWNVVKAFSASVAADFADPVNGWYANCNNFVPNATGTTNTCALQNLLLTGNSGTTPSAGQLATASPDNAPYLAEYVAKGCFPPIAIIHSSTDGTIYPPSQELLISNAATAGCTIGDTVVGQVGGAYTGHALDEGTKGPFTWLNVALSNTAYMSAAGSSGYCAYSFPTCGYIGLTFQTFWQFSQPTPTRIVP